MSLQHISEDEIFISELARAINYNYGSLLRPDPHTLSARLDLPLILDAGKLNAENLSSMIAKHWLNHQAEMRTVYSSMLRYITIFSENDDVGDDDGGRSRSVRQKEEEDDLKKQLTKLLSELDQQEKKAESAILKLSKTFVSDDSTVDDSDDAISEKDDVVNPVRDSANLACSLLEYHQNDVTRLLQLISSCKLSSVQEFMSPAILKTAATLENMSILIYCMQVAYGGKDLNGDIRALTIRYSEAIVSIKKIIDNSSSLLSLEDEVYALFNCYFSYLNNIAEYKDKLQKMLFPLSGDRKNQKKHAPNIFTSFLMGATIDENEPLHSILKELSEKTLLFDSKGTSNSHEKFVEMYRDVLARTCSNLLTGTAVKQGCKLYQALQLGTQESAEATWYRELWGRGTARVILKQLSNPELAIHEIRDWCEHAAKYRNGESSILDFIPNIYQLSEVYCKWPDLDKEFRKVSRNNCRLIVHGVIEKGTDITEVPAMFGLLELMDIKDPNSFEGRYYCGFFAACGSMCHFAYKSDALLADSMISFFEHPKAQQVYREEIFTTLIDGPWKFLLGGLNKSLLAYIEEALGWYDEDPMARKGQNYPKYFVDD